MQCAAKNKNCKKTKKKSKIKKQESMKLKTQWENGWVREKQKMDSKHRDSCIVFMMGLCDRQVCEMFDQKSGFLCWPLNHLWWEMYRVG